MDGLRQFQGSSSSRRRIGMVGDAGEHVGEPGLRIDVVELGGDDQAVDDGGALAAAVGAGEQPCLAAERDAAQRSLGGIVGEADPAVVEEAGEGGPARQHVVDGLGDVGMAGQPGALGRASRLRARRPAARCAAGARQGALGRHAVDLALDGEERVDPLHRLERDRRDDGSLLAAPCARDVGQLEELAPAHAPSRPPR